MKACKFKFRLSTKNPNPGPQWNAKWKLHLFQMQNISQNSKSFIINCIRDRLCVRRRLKMYV